MIQYRVMEKGRKNFWVPGAATFDNREKAQEVIDYSEEWYRYRNLTIPEYKIQTREIIETEWSDL